ncbi:FCS-Like Zinc finger 5-like [Humulus lupulus]|uniref:FCS-Like Zinc finger 5-like n=1 Tax=Humulus lupulus TaxID=3486 RepID=UPI002B4043B6|nr:FCS-Like Zinc finger 5-like [Humulus lupulus]
MLGKRPRTTMKRTTSMTEITFDLNTNDESQPFDPHNPLKKTTAAGAGGDHQRIQGGLCKSNSADFTQTTKSINTTSHFLRACFLCKRRLVPNRDIYMYRGISAYCSLECRQHQINHDEKMDKEAHASNSAATSARPHVSTKSETTTVPALWPPIITPKR